MVNDSSGRMIHDRLATVAIEQSRAPNYLDSPSLSAMRAAISALQRDQTVREICLSGPPESFLLGVDPSFFLESLVGHQLNIILSFTRTARETLSEIEHSPKPVVAWIRGAALGAGVELALACQRIVASPTAKFSLPETGLGIYPGMGGTQRLPRRIGVGLAKWMIYTGSIVPAPQALEIGLIDAIHPTATTAAEACQALDPQGVTGQPQNLSASSGARFRMLEELFTQHDVATLCDPSFAAPADPQAVRAVVQMRGKAPLALRLAEQIIDRGMKLTLDQGLDEEFSHLAEIFSSEDALIGVTSAGKRPPQFLGR